MLRLKTYFCFILSVKLLVSVTSQSNSDQEYYWKDYNGNTPRDAVPGGKDKNGGTSYIGQAYHETGALIPGQINPNEEVLVYHYDGKVYKVSRNVKILCSPHRNRFEWIKTNDKDLRFLTQRHLVPGGFDDDYPLLIGRAPKQGEVVVGKVTIYHGFRGFAYVINGRAPHEHQYYEVLAYNQQCDCDC